MIGAIVLLVFGLIVFFGILIFIARTEAKPGPPPMQTKSLREIENTLLDIQRYTTDTYASGKASGAADRLRELLDKADHVR